MHAQQLWMTQQAFRKTFQLVLQRDPKIAQRPIRQLTATPQQCSQGMPVMAMAMP